MKAIDIVLPPAKTEKELWDRSMNYLGGLANEIKHPKRIKVKFL